MRKFRLGNIKDYVQGFLGGSNFSVIFHPWVFIIVPEMNKCHSIIPKPEKNEKRRTRKTSDSEYRHNEIEPARTKKWD